ncbi:MAG: hypothetical protein V4734_03055 [Terriglobus sp.]
MIHSTKEIGKFEASQRPPVAILESVRTSALLLSAVVAFPLAGCKSKPVSPAVAAAQIDDARRDLAQIPPPSKNLYMNVGSLNAWQNPYLTVQEKMITLHVLMPDANPSDLGKGTMLRPEAARRQTLNIDPVNLAEALNAIPKEAWPYGRVIAIEEAHDAPEAARRPLRVNMEKAIDTLNAVGVIADERANDRPLGVR